MKWIKCTSYKDGETCYLNLALAVGMVWDKPHKCTAPYVAWFLRLNRNS